MKHGREKSMSKKIKRKIVISVISAVMILILAIMILALWEMVDQWVPILEKTYFISAELYFFSFIACFFLIALIIAVNLILWFYEKIFKEQ